MPHLQFDTTVALAAEEQRAFADEIAELYADHMSTGTGHIAVTVHAADDGTFWLGRLDADEEGVMLNADIREGRTDEQKRDFVLAAFETAEERWGVPTANMYAVVTEHVGREFHEDDRTLSSWGEHEAEDGAD